MNEKEILKRLQKGDVSALKAVWEMHSSHVLNLAFRILLDRDSAEDILMDVFVQIPEAIHSFHGNSALSTWLYMLTKNACLMKLRKEKAHLRIEETRHFEIRETAFGKREETEEILTQNALSCGLSILTPEQRSLLWLKDAEGFDMKTLCEIFNAPEGTLKSKLSRARAQVREFLKKEKSYARRN
ncbi:MAG: RNA polymerase sigma factor [Hallerella porci]|nr:MULTISPECIES: RNA polymerase sigma factor [Hallerella]MCI5600464.1 RNA polymerase sigma factor [Hallerella sp.]MDY3922274.1 RNA polymerase sigma factor [Hallerella porci]